MQKALIDFVQMKAEEKRNPASTLFLYLLFDIKKHLTEPLKS